jgi:hypothetical protein
MSLSKEEKRKVRKALLRQIAVQKLQTPLEYHYFAWHWNWQVYSFDDGDTERTALISQDNVFVIVPPNSVVLAIKRSASENAIGRFFDLLGTYTRTQDFSQFYALNWMALVRR